jgi:hypothetical protein
MTDAEGTFQFALEVVHRDTEATVVRVAPIRHTFRDRLVFYPFHVRFRNAPFAAPGWYEVRLLLDGAPEPLAVEPLMLR